MYTTGLDPGPMQKGLASASAGLEKFKGLAGSLAGTLSVIGVSFAAFKSAEGIADSLKGVFEAGKELRTVSAETGETVGSLVTLRKAFKEVGLSPDAVSHSIIMLQKALGGVNEEGQPTSFIFRQLGLNMAQLKGETAAQQMEQVGAALRKLPTTADRSAAAMKMFGRQGAEMMALFNDPKAIADAQKSMGGIAAIMQRDSGMFAAITNDLEALSGKMRGFFTGVADQLGPILLPILDKLKSIDLTRLGQQAGQMVSIIAEAFKNGSIGDLLWTSLQVAGSSFANLMMQVLTGLAGSLGAVWRAEFQEAAALFTHLGSVWEGVKDGLTGAIQAAGVVLLEVFQRPIVALQAGLDYAMQTLMEKMGQIPKLGKWMGLDGFKAQNFDDVYKDHQQQGASLFGFNSADLAGKATENLKKAGAAMQDVFSGVNFGAQIHDVVKAFKDGMASGNVIDTTALEAKLKKMTEGLAAAGKRAADSIRDANSDTVKTQGAGKNLTQPLKAAPADRLAKMGLFIGGGGPAGERAAQDTAKNTRSLLDEARKQTGLWTGHLMTGHLKTGHLVF